MRVTDTSGALYPSKSGLIHKNIVKYVFVCFISGALYPSKSRLHVV